MSELIKMLYSSNKILIKCPNCSETFHSKQGSLFDIREKYPKKIINHLENSLNEEKKEKDSVSKKIQRIDREIKNIKLEKNILMLKIRQQPQKVRTITKYVNIGQILEKILPASKEFSFNLSDCRAIFDPIDYISFNGLSRKKHIESITFIEIKTGQAILQRNQKDIKDKISRNKVKFLEY